MAANGTKLSHDAVTQLLFDQINSGIEKINEANVSLLAEEEQGAGLREIDKALKDGTHENEEVSALWAKATELQVQFKKALDDARNAYRTEVLKEEAKAPTSDVDKDAVKEQRKVVMQSVDLLKTYATANGKKDIVDWASSLSIPQVGRAGSSVVGQKKPRAYVSVNGTRHESFGEAAKAATVLLSTDDNKVVVTSGDLVSAWDSNGEAAEFEFNGLTVGVEMKTAAKAAA